MKPEYVTSVLEAIENMKQIDFFTMTSREYNEFTQEVENGLNLQIAKKPRGFNDECWSCGEYLSTFYDNPNYCPNCGQRADWSEEE